jgi:methionine aminopeptidase, type I
MITLKNEREIAQLRESGRIVAETLKELENALVPNMSTLDLDEIAEDYIRKKGATPSFKGYNGFSGSICTSPNEVVVHGIPSDDVIIKEGDIISLDCGAYLNGYHGDAARTLACGEVSEAASNLIEATKNSFYQGLEQCVIGNRIGDIGHAVQVYAENLGYGVVRDFCGHGIGKNLHEDPQVPNYGKPGFGARIKKGMCLAIEPMINEGTYEVEVLDDDWTTVTRDGKLAAHYENSIAITEDGAVILTDL